MAPLPRWRRILRITLFAVVGVILVLVTFVQIQQRILRWRAEHLLADIRNLELGKSTWADAQRIMHRWGKWGRYEGECSERRCNYQIVMQDDFYAFPEYFLPSGHKRSEARAYSRWTLTAYRFLGGRPALIGASVIVINGVVWGRDYDVTIDAWKPFEREETEFVLMASASTVWRTEAFHQTIHPSHPEYVVGRPGGCTFCVYGYLRFTPFSDPREIQRLMDFNLDCLTRFSSCQEQIDILPAAWRLYLKEDDALQAQLKSGPLPSTPCPTSLEYQGRNQENVVLAQVVSTHPHETDDTALDVDFHLIDRYKRATFWKADAIWTVNIPAYKSSQNGPGTIAFQAGRQVILLFSDQYSWGYRHWLELYPCAPIPLTDQNLAALKRGITADIFPEDRNVWP